MEKKWLNSLIGGTTGFFTGGPVGAVVGGTTGYFSGGDEEDNGGGGGSQDLDWLRKITENFEPRRLADYPETDTARGQWGSKLTEWGGQPGYGAISPNFADIWENVSKKVRQYYWGGPMEPGLVSKVKSNLAQRGMSEQPAAEDLIARMGAQEGQQLQDIAVQMAMEEANLAEKGRQKWLASTQDLANLKPSYWYPGEVTTQKQPSQQASETSQDESSLLGYILNYLGGSMGSQGGTTQGSANTDSGGDLLSSLMKLFQGSPQKFPTAQEYGVAG